MRMIPWTPPFQADEDPCEDLEVPEFQVAGDAADFAEDYPECVSDIYLIFNDPGGGERREKYSDNYRQLPVHAQEPPWGTRVIDEVDVEIVIITPIEEGTMDGPEGGGASWPSLVVVGLLMFAAGWWVGSRRSRASS
ncbi:MAG: hypothetical protein AAF682_11990 [Planctomycetota bacterium]